jgi:hypothetical protein
MIKKGECAINKQQTPHAIRNSKLFLIQEGVKV